MVGNGRERAQRFTREGIGDAWEDLLFRTLAPDYHRWARSSVATRVAKFAFRLARKKTHGRKYSRGYDEFVNEITR